MTPRARKLLFDAIIAATLIAAATVSRAAYTGAASQPRIDRGNQILNYTAPPLHPHIACAFAIAEECRKMEWWPE